MRHKLSRALCCCWARPIHFVFFLKHIACLQTHWVLISSTQPGLCAQKKIWHFCQLSWGIAVVGGIFSMCRWENSKIYDLNLFGCNCSWHELLICYKVTLTGCWDEFIDKWSMVHSCIHVQPNLCLFGHD